MKKFVIAVMLAAVGVTPALAKAPAHDRSERSSHAYTSSVPSPAVVVDGHVVGHDPDASIRLSLRRDAYTGWN